MRSLFLISALILSTFCKGQDYVSNKWSEVKLADSLELFKGEWQLTNFVKKRKSRIPLKNKEYLNDPFIYVFSKSELRWGNSKDSTDAGLTFVIDEDDNPDYFFLKTVSQKEGPDYEQMWLYPMIITDSIMVINVHCCKRINKRGCMSNYCFTWCFERVH